MKIDAEKMIAEISILENAFHRISGIGALFFWRGV